jgi:HipA-like protein
MSIVISEIVRRSEQGVTMPFICRSEAGETYFVKGLGVGAEGLRAEWIGGHLSKALKLPVAPFSIVEVPPILVRNSAVEGGAAELLGTFAFGSRVVPGAREITFAQVQDLPLEQRAEILLFDWWIRHADRNLGALGGNPNLLISPGDENPLLWLIDHHNGFDQAFDETQFWKRHIFTETRGIWSPAWQKRATTRLRQASKGLAKAWDTMPANWFPDGDSTSPDSVLEYDRLAGILARPTLAPVDFWKIP